MVNYSQPNQPKNFPDKSDVRIGSLLQDNTKPAKVVIVGFPSDLGVGINGGRVGAKTAPAVIRQQFYKMTPDPRCVERFKEILAVTVDYGDIVLGDNLEENQKLLSQSVSKIIGSGAIPVVLGGGHETSYGHFLGLTQSRGMVNIVNLDAHLDVRELKSGQGHSGSPFRQCIETGRVTNYTVLGANPRSVSAEHYKYIIENQGELHFVNDLDRDVINQYFNMASDQDTLVTVDLDALKQSEMPAVSAPSAEGVSLDLYYHYNFLAGKTSRVKCFDMVELNPLYDIDDQGARVAASGLWEFFRGLCERSEL